MQNQSPLTIYNASAGSGKTFTLVKDYLKLLFQSQSQLAFRYILALTFTNKAVGEMKARLIEMLKLFSEASILESPNSMFKVLVDELQIEPKQLHRNSQQILERIIHNYAAFDISTIDKFNHKLIRTFAYDLKLPVNFEVELDTTTMLGKAVDKLIDKAGSDEELTKVLVDFAIEKTDDDKSWDISYDFNNIAKLLVNENEIPYLDRLKDKTLDDFKALKTKLQKQQKEVEQQIIARSETILTSIRSNGLEFEDFTRQTLPNHFKKAGALNFTGLYSNNLQGNLAERTKIYSSKLDEQKARAIDDLLPEIEASYLTIKQLVYSSKFLNNALKNITPLSVLSAISKSLQDIKDEDDLLLISEFNSIINNEIKTQPAPFIYERIGEKFKHYFIDEFQDTSVLQWENLIPLVSNAVTGQNLKGEIGTAMLVGDAKQAIYRWRGGRAEQFIDLYSEGNPFHIEKKVKNLPINYRSYRTVVEFNNRFFNHIADFAFSNSQHQHIYKNANQKVFLDKEGYVNIQFLDTKNEDKNQLQCEAVLNTIKKAQRNGFALKDMCIIVRKTKEGIAIAQFLSDLDIDIISSETLLLKNSPEVEFINHIITLSLHPKNDEVKVQLLNFIAEYKLELEDTHQFFSELIHLKAKVLFDKLHELGFEFNYLEFLQLPIYEAVESVIRGFNLNETSNAYIQFYLDEVFDYSQKYNASFSGFLEYWYRKNDKLSIVSPSGKDAIQIMTIHKSKGLEFPVVIFPYANQDIYADISPKVWFPVDEAQFNGFSHLYLNMNKDLEEFNEKGAEIYNQYRSQLELDSINLLYVVLTRAIAQLYVISEYDLDKSKQEKLTHYSGLFINYLKSTGQWKDNELNYSFGNLNHASEVKEEISNTIEQTQFISTKKEDHNLNIITNSGYLWDTVQEKAIERGNLVHQIMSLIKTEVDTDFALDHFLNTGLITNEQSEELKLIIDNILKHEQLTYLFDSKLTIYNEKDIISKDGKLLRPDRIVINSKNQAIIVDYKTGLQDSKHREQLFDYQYVLEDMNFEVTKKILIYINDDIVIKEF
ncbi:exodeoxyribonuclease V subunit beta [uncultured Psychroserpens sp.]|uniref:UvrD-helicase domain-containing protein n=1 Tax=uncultured Psychroserpens sp. TaxID=255436 RepID=UPI002612ADA8|nr:UvrD-helicase domain-containing protein [uncultured Psychroserpens sp.]